MIVNAAVSYKPSLMGIIFFPFIFTFNQWLAANLILRVKFPDVDYRSVSVAFPMLPVIGYRQHNPFVIISALCVICINIFMTGRTQRIFKQKAFIQRCFFFLTAVLIIRAEYRLRKSGKSVRVGGIAAFGKLHIQRIGFIAIAVSGKIRNIIGAADFWQFTCYVKVYIGKSRISGTLLAVPEIFCISEAVTDCLLQGLNSIIISRSLITKFQYCT